MKRFSFILLIFVILHVQPMIIPDGSCADQSLVIKFASVAPKGSTWIKHMDRLDKKIREKTNGRLGFRIYAGGIAGDEMDVLRKIRIGQIHSTAFSGVGIAQILPETRVLDLPFLFRDREEIELVLSELFDHFEAKFKEKGFTLLSWVEVGDVYLFSKKEIRAVNDLKGLKIWTWAGDPISKITFSELKCSPIPLSITDVKTALSTNMIDSFYGPPLGILALQWYNEIEYITTPPMAHSTGVLLISNPVFDKIPKDLSNLFKVEVKLSMEELTRELIAQSQEAIDLIQDRGIQVVTISGPELKEFYQVHDIVAERLINEVYPDELLQKVYDILADARSR